MQPRHRRAFLRIVATLSATGLLAACGFKGPLYMPGSPQDTRHHREPPPAIKPGESAPETAEPAATPQTAPGAATQQTPAGRPDPVPNLFQ